MMLPCSVNPDLESTMLQHLSFDLHPETDIVNKITKNDIAKSVTYKDALGKKTSNVIVQPTGRLFITANDLTYLYESARKAATTIMQHYGLTRSQAEEELLLLSNKEKIQSDLIRTAEII